MDHSGQLDVQPAFGRTHSLALVGRVELRKRNKYLVDRLRVARLNPAFGQVETGVMLDRMKITALVIYKISKLL
jgi:hypothetical protein